MLAWSKARLFHYIFSFELLFFSFLFSFRICKDSSLCSCYVVTRGVVCRDNLFSRLVCARSVSNLHRNSLSVLLCHESSAMEDHRSKRWQQLTSHLTINKPLLPLKAVMFLYYAGINNIISYYTMYTSWYIGNKCRSKLKMYFLIVYEIIAVYWCSPPITAVTMFMPYITLHMVQIGLSIEEVAIIYAILPFVSCLGSPTAGKQLILPFALCLLSRWPRNATT